MTSEYWDRHAAHDPLWAILSDPSKADRRWDLASFMATGEREIGLVFEDLRQSGLLTQRKRALDFGCGVGRLTQALARRFESAVGIDISPQMVTLAASVNAYDTRVTYKSINTITLGSAIEGRFDFIYSNLVLQHIEPATARQHIETLIRALEPGGLFVFQLPSHRAPSTKPPIAMPDSAYRAAITISELEAATCPPSSLVDVVVQITNESATSWNTEDCGAIRVGNHWLDDSGQMVIQDDGRVDLPSVLRPGETCSRSLQVTTPREGGRYACEVDLVHEGVTWFQDRGSRAARTTVTVRGAESNAAPATANTASSARDWLPDYQGVDFVSNLPPVASTEIEPFPMHGILKADVLELIERAGGEAVRVLEDDHAKPDWVGFRYYVRPKKQRWWMRLGR